MVGDLLGNVAVPVVIGAVHLKGLAEDRVERFGDALRGRERRDGKGDHLEHPVDGRRGRGRLLQQPVKLHILGELLQERERFIKVDRHRDL